MCVLVEEEVSGEGGKGDRELSCNSKSFSVLVLEGYFGLTKYSRYGNGNVRGNQKGGGGRDGSSRNR